MIKTHHPATDPLNNLIFNITFSDKIDGSEVNANARPLYTGGGVEALEEHHSTDFGYISKKLDFYGAMDSEYDFFDSVVTPAIAQVMRKNQRRLVANSA